MTKQLLQALALLEAEVNTIFNTEPYDLERLGIIMVKTSVFPLIEELTDQDDKRNLLLRLQKLLNDITDCLAAENKHISSELEKFQLAKKGSARYHDMQKP